MLLILLCWSPFIMHPDSAIKIGDWEMFMAFYEAVRKNIVDYGQFPFWNPWHFGGTPLFARPQIAVFSLETMCSIIFGTVYGLRIAIVLYVLLGAVGMWLLLGQYVKNSSSRYFGSVLFGLQGAVALHMMAGHPVMISIVFLPWLLFFLNRLSKDRTNAILFGFISAMLVNHSLHYVSLTIAVCLLLFCIGKLVLDWSNKLIMNFVWAGLAFLTFGSYRLIVTLDLLREFPRIIGMRADVPLHTYLLGLTYPGQSLSTFPDPLKLYWGWFEIGCYVGVVALTMFIISFIKNIKWWHWGFLITSLLTVNSSCKFLPGYWIRELPGFSSFFCITRWRFLAVFFLVVGACVGFDWMLSNSSKRGQRIRLYCLLVISTLGLIYNQYFNWRGIEWIAEKQMLDTVKCSSDTILTVQNRTYNRYGSVKKGIGRLFAYEPLMGYVLDYKNKRLAAPNSNYYGEFFQLKGTLTGLYWSPNFIELIANGNAGILVNQNPGNYWRDSNNKKIFPNLKSFDTDKHFILKFPADGKVSLYLRPRLHEIALGISILSAFLLIVGILIVNYREKKNSNLATTSES
jgi:hypothetical protein